MVTPAGRALAHPDGQIRRGRRVVPHSQRPETVQQRGNRIDVGDDAGDVRCGGESPDAQRALRILTQPGEQIVLVDPTARILADRHHLGAGLAPRQLVGVVLEGTHEHHRALRVRHRTGTRGTAGTQPEQSDELVDRGRRTRPAEQHNVVVPCSHRAMDDLPGLFPCLGGESPGDGGLRVGVAVRGQHPEPDQVLDEVKRSARRGVIGIGEATRAERAVDQVAVADQPVPDPDQQGGVGAPRRR